MPPPNPTGETKIGVCYALLAYFSWGLFPIYWKLVAAVPALQMVAHRIVWSVFVLALLLLLSRRWSGVVLSLRTPRQLFLLSVTAALVSGNWLVFIWAVQNGFVLQTSLGYYINPLLNIVLGMVFLGERLRPRQTAAVLLAAIGVGNLIFQLGVIPWIALALALSFGFYGLLRKTAPVDGLVGLSVETLLLLPIALGYLVYLDAQNLGVFLNTDWRLDVLIAQSGWATALPLLWFANAARRLSYSTIGFLQYLAPTCQFILAVAVYDEPLTHAHLITFGCIWAALAVYTLDTFIASRQMRLGRISLKT